MRTHISGSANSGATSPDIEVKLTDAQIFLACTALICFGCGAAAWYAGQGSETPYFCIFGLIAGFYAVVVGRIYINSEYVKYVDLFGTHLLRWEDIGEIKYNAKNAVGFYSRRPKTRIVVLGSMYWSGPQRQEALDFLSAEAKRRNITWTNIPGGILEGTKNCRVKNNSSR